MCDGRYMREQVIIEARWNGPPGSGNGGCTAGLVASALARELSGAVVTLRQPPPLETPLRVTPQGDGAAVYAGEVLVAEADPAELTEQPVPPVPLADAVAAAKAYPGFEEHPFPTCYVCGPRREDGLRIFPGPCPDGGTAAPWHVPADVTAATVWGALDCPGGWAIIAPGRPYVMGRMTTRVDAVPQPGTSCVLTGAVSEVEGRKAQVRTALYGADGELLAQASATWIALPAS